MCDLDLSISKGVFWWQGGESLCNEYEGVFIKKERGGTSLFSCLLGLIVELIYLVTVGFT